MADEELHTTPTDGQVDGSGAADARDGRAGSQVTAEVESFVETDIDDAGETQARDGKKAAKRDEAQDAPDLADAVTYAENDEIPVGALQDVLNATVDEEHLTPQMRRMIQRQKDNTKRVEESIKGTKANPGWYVPLFCALMIIGLVWAVVFYLTGNQYPIPNIGFWNLAIAFAFILAGFLMTVGWR